MSRINILGMKILLLGVLVHSYLCSIIITLRFFKARVNINQKPFGKSKKKILQY
jgi:hypothetical protein